MSSPTLRRLFQGVQLLFALLIFTIPAFSQQLLQEKIGRVENGLFPTLQIADSNYQGLSIESRMKQLGINGVSIAVISNYKLDWAKGYGMADTATKRPVTTSTLFLAGSISKSVNAMGVLKLADAKKIDLAANINTYLRSWKFPEDSFTRDKKITTANLLSHTAGLSVHGFPGYTPGDSIPSVPQILDGQRPANTAAVRSIFPPGLRLKYSGGGTTISQLMVADVTGMPYEDYMQKEVLNPLGMKGSTYWQPTQSGKWETLATAYKSDGREVKGRFHIYPEMAAAGLWTTPTDLSKFIIETQRAYAGKSNKILSQAITKRMLTHHVDSAAGLGVFFSEAGGRRFFGHGGADEGFRALYFGSFEGGNGAAVMVNSDNGAIMNEIMNSIATAYGWPVMHPVDKRKTVALPVDSLQRFVGRYLFNDGDSATISLKEGTAYLDFNEGPVRMHFTDNRSFFTFRYPYGFSFVNNGEAIELHVRAGELYIGKKRE